MPGGFFGTLASELTEEVPLTGAFAELHARFEQLRDAYLAGRIDQTTFGRYLMDLRVLDQSGILWTIGASSGRWYRRAPQDGRTWSPTHVPTNVTGMVVDRFGEPSGWATQTAAPQPAAGVGAVPSEFAGSGAAGSGASGAGDSDDAAEPARSVDGNGAVNVDALFGTYVETEGTEVEVGSTVLEGDLTGGTWTGVAADTSTDDEIPEDPTEPAVDPDLIALIQPDETL